MINEKQNPYKTVAHGIRLAVLDSDEEELKTIRFVASSICNAIETQDGNFDRKQFLEDCGLLPEQED